MEILATLDYPNWLSGLMFRVPANVTDVTYVF